MGIAKLLTPVIPLFQEGRSRRLLLKHVLDGLVLFRGFSAVTATEFLNAHTPHSILSQAVWNDSKASRV